MLDKNNVFLFDRQPKIKNKPFNIIFDPDKYIFCENDNYIKINYLVKRRYKNKNTMAKKGSKRGGKKGPTGSFW